MKKNAPLGSFDGICNLSNQDKVVENQVANAHVSIVFCLILAKKKKVFCLMNWTVIQHKYIGQLATPVNKIYYNISF